MTPGQIEQAREVLRHVWQRRGTPWLAEQLGIDEQKLRDFCGHDGLRRTPGHPAGHHPNDSALTGDEIQRVLDAEAHLRAQN